MQTKYIVAYANGKWTIYMLSDNEHLSRYYIHYVTVEVAEDAEKICEALNEQWNRRSGEGWKRELEFAYEAGYADADSGFDNNFGKWLERYISGRED